MDGQTEPTTTDTKAVTTTEAQPEGWLEWAEKTVGTPNDWLDASPTAKSYQMAANEFFKGIGNWSYETAKYYAPELVGETPAAQPQKEADPQEKEMQAVENAPADDIEN